MVLLTVISLSMKTQFLAVVIFFSATSFLTGQERIFNLNDSPDNQVVKKASAEAQPSLGITNALRYRELFINPVLQNNDMIGVGDTILLDVFDDRSYKAVVNRVETDVNITFAINATLPAYRFATCEISSFEKKSLLVLDIPEKNELYKANYNHDVRSYYLKEVDKSQEIRLEGSPSVIPEASGQDDSDKKNKLW